MCVHLELMTLMSKVMLSLCLNFMRHLIYGMHYNPFSFISQTRQSKLGHILVCLSVWLTDSIATHGEDKNYIKYQPLPHLERGQRSCTWGMGTCWFQIRGKKERKQGRTQLAVTHLKAYMYVWYRFFSSYYLFGGCWFSIVLFSERRTKKTVRPKIMDLLNLTKVSPQPIQTSLTAE